VTDVSFSEKVRAVFDPIVVPEGFASGQGDASQVIFCASLDQLAARLPRLPQVGLQPAGSGACVDLVVSADDEGRLASVQLEGISLEDTLRRVGLVGRAVDVGEALRADRGRALTAASSALRDLLAASR
jgi:hypothetical protein